MSDAIDNAEVMLYAVSEAYKESGNCRLEANYAHQQDVDMIPLKVQDGYKAKGWLGLILGTRMWYRFYGCEDEDEAAFEARVDPVAREIGERGKARGELVSEGVPPSASAAHASVQRSSVRPPAPAPEPAPAPAPVPAPAPAMPRPVAQPAALTSAPTPDRSFTPSLVQSPPQALAAGTTGSLAELATFMEKQQLMMKEQQQMLLEQQKEAKQEVEQLEAKIEKLMAPQEAVSDQQVEAVTARLQAVHAAQLLSDDELFAVEDAIADFLEVKAACGVVTPMIVNTQDAAGKVHKLVVLSGGMADDAMFARQVRRKFV